MTFSGDDGGPSAHPTQGGHRDALSPGPARRAGNSFWWFAVALLLMVAIAVFVLTTRSHKHAPAERNTTPVSGETGPTRVPAGTAGAR
jgi:hypothetical protein